jgi:hypothetical protein
MRLELGQQRVEKGVVSLEQSPDPESIVAGPPART